MHPRKLGRSLAFPLLLCALPFLSGCLLVAGANLLTHDVECEAMRSDRERGVVDSTAWREKHCAEVEQERVAEARKVIDQADRQKIEDARKLVEEADRQKAQVEEARKLVEQANQKKGGGL